MNKHWDNVYPKLWHAPRRIQRLYNICSQPQKVLKAVLAPGKSNHMNLIMIWYKRCHKAKVYMINCQTVQTIMLWVQRLKRAEGWVHRQTSIKDEDRGWSLKDGQGLYSQTGMRRQWDVLHWGVSHYHTQLGGGILEPRSPVILSQERCLMGRSDNKECSSLQKII